MATNSTVQNIKDNRGIKFLLGCVLIFLLIKWAWTGSLMHVFEAVRGVGPDDDVASAGNAIVDSLFPIVVDLVMAMGGVGLSIALGIWDVVWSLIQTAILYGTPKTTPAVEPVAGSASVAVPASQPAASAGASEKKISLSKLIATLESLDSRLSVLESGKPAPVASAGGESNQGIDSSPEPADRLALLESQVSAIAASVAKLAKPTKAAAKTTAKTTGG